LGRRNQPRKVCKSQREIATQCGGGWLAETRKKYGKTKTNMLRFSRNESSPEIKGRAHLGGKHRACSDKVNRQNKDLRNKITNNGITLRGIEARGERVQAYSWEKMKGRGNSSVLMAEKKTRKTSSCFVGGVYKIGSCQKSAGECGKENINVTILLTVGTGRGHKKHDLRGHQQNEGSSKEEYAQKKERNGEGGSFYSWKKT